MQKIRLQKYLSQAGVASRREGERLILAGKVSVNGELVTTLGIRITPEKDTISVAGRVITPEKKVYLLLNKPAGYLCSLKDRFGRPLVTELIGGIPQRLYPVGRLDLNSEGLLFMTNDGDFSQRLIHPRHQVEKTYQVRLKTGLNNIEKDRLTKGVVLDDGFRTSPARIKVLSPDRRQLEITIREGKKRQVKRMLEAVGNKVNYLRRVAIGPVKLGKLPRGKWRKLEPSEISALKAAAKKP